MSGQGVWAGYTGERNFLGLVYKNAKCLAEWRMANGEEEREGDVVRGKCRYAECHRVRDIRRAISRLAPAKSRT